MDETKGSHRTRSRAAPDWSLEESLILLNEIKSVESEWGPTLPSFQKWQQIVENCNALDVYRNMNQCKRKWEALLDQYKLFKNGAGPNEFFSLELFDAVDNCIAAGGKKNGGSSRVDSEEETEEDPVLEEEQGVMDTDPDSDPEAQGRVTKSFTETGSKKQGRRMKRKKYITGRQNPWGYFTSSKTQHKDCINATGKLGNSNSSKTESVPDEVSVEKEQIMASILWENAMQMNAILEGNLPDDADMDYKLIDLKNAEAVETDLTRRKADKLIDCLEKLSATLSQLCKVDKH